MTDSSPHLHGAPPAFSDLVILVAEDGRVLDWSPAAEQAFGYAREQAVGQRLSDVIGVTGEPGAPCEVEARHQDGHVVFCEQTVHPVRLGDSTHRAVCLRRPGLREEPDGFAAALDATGAALAMARSAGDIATAVARHALTAARASAVSLVLRHGDELLQYPGGTSLPPGPSARAAASVLETGRAVSADPGLTVLPLAVGHEVLGALALVPEDGPPRGRRQRFLEHLAAQCARTLHWLSSLAESGLHLDRLEALSNGTVSILWTRDAAGRFVDRQPQSEAFTGQDLDGYRGMGWLDAIHPDDREEAERRCLEGIASGVTYHTRYRLRHRSGGYRVMAMSAVPLRTADGRLREWMGFHRDITREHRARARLTALHAMNAALGKAHTEAAAANVILEHAGPALGACGGAVLGIRGETLSAHAIGGGFPEPGGRALVPAAAAVRGGGPVYLSPDELSDRDPALAQALSRPLHLAILPLSAGGSALGVLLLTFEESLTDREREVVEDFAHQCARALDNIRAYAAARDAEARLSGIIGTVSDAVVTTDADRRILVFNAAAADMFRVSASEAMGQPIERFIPAQYHELHAEHMQAFGTTGVSARSMHGTRRALPALRGDGSQFAVEATISQVEVGGERLFTAVMRDVSEQLRAESALRESEQRFRATFNQAAVGIAQTGLDGRWLSVNEKLGEIVGHAPQELLRMRFQDITHPDDLPNDLAHVDLLLSGQMRTYALRKRYLRRDGQTIWTNLTVSLVRRDDDSPHYFVAVIEDISAIVAAEAELVQARDELERRVEKRTSALQAIGSQLQQQVQELELRNEEARLLGEMGEMLQSCFHTSEVQQVVRQYAAQLFPDAAGTLYSFGPSRNVLEEMNSWNGRSASAPLFAPLECWALRRGRLFVSVSHSGASGPACVHLRADHQGFALCVPLLAQGETVGLLHLSQTDAFSTAQERLAQTVAETTALATVNLRLRESLRQQSIRDPLTGLFNRRYLEETFEREARRAQRQGHPIGVVMLDVDHFKAFNDTFGHEAGDALLKDLGRVLQGGVRGEDVACRYGGEEFSLLLPGASLEQTGARAEQLRLAIRDLRVVSRGELLGTVTASMGVAAFPGHGEELYDLIRTADAALYRAKQQGRNRVVLAS